jgi:hypothetical protein
MRVYIGGTMRASHDDDSFVDQNYRTKIIEILGNYYHDMDFFDPLKSCGIDESNKVTSLVGKEVFFKEIREVATCDLLIAYLPEASMGTAIEMWEAYQWDVPIISITTMKENWTVKFLSDLLVSNLEEFEDVVEKGAVNLLLQV